MTEVGSPTATPGVTYRLGSYEVTAPIGFGPRLLGLRCGGGPEILARLDPEVAIDAGDAGLFRFRGGHRLWVSPEVPGLTYVPDDDPCQVLFEDGVLQVSGPVDRAGFAKELEVRAKGDRLVVDHRLTWSGPERVTGGAWSITQLPLGGLAILPVGGAGNDLPFQADRSLVLWPYTDLADRRLSLRSGAVVIRAEPGPRLKVGSGPAPDRLGYLHQGWLFIKTVEPAGDGDYADRGAVGQVFTDESFCELETLGPIVDMVPGALLRHREIWQVVECPDLEAALDRVVGEHE